MPRKTEVIDTFYQGVTKDGRVVKTSKSRNTVKRFMRHHPDGEIQTRDLVGYYTPWTTSPEPKEADQ
jgi:hypothetical protein